MQKLPVNNRAFNELESQLRAGQSLSGVCLHIPWNQIETKSANRISPVLTKRLRFFVNSA